MRPIAAVEFPADVEETHRKARRMEWATVAYVASAAAAFLDAAMGTFQTMRTSLFEEVVSVVPAVALWSAPA